MDMDLISRLEDMFKQQENIENIIKVINEYPKLVNTKNPRGGWTPLRICVSLCTTDEDGAKCITALLEHGADQFVKATKGLAPIHEAARRGLVETVKVFIKSNKEALELTSYKGAKTPLHFAAEGLEGEESYQQNIETINELINKGANLHALSLTKSTAAHYAQTQEIFQHLVEKGIDLGIVNERGETAYGKRMLEEITTFFENNTQRNDEEDGDWGVRLVQSCVEGLTEEEARNLFKNVLLHIHDKPLLLKHENELKVHAYLCYGFHHNLLSQSIINVYN